MAPDSYNRLPAGLMASPANASNSAPSGAVSDSFQSDSGSGGSMLPMVISILALLLACSALYLELSKPATAGISPTDRAALRSIASSLRTMQQKEFVTTSPTINTNVQVDKSFPLSDILPGNMTIPLTADVPFQTSFSAMSQSGQVTSFRVNDTLRIRAEIPVDLNKSGQNEMITIHQTIPVNTRISGSFKFSNVFPTEFNTMIQTLEQMAGDVNSSG